jgi:pteridine reductase
MQKKPSGRTTLMTPVDHGRADRDTALVTGAARRIGRAIALSLADSGLNVVVHFNTSPSEARGLVSEIKEKGVSSWAVSGDFETDRGCAALIGDAAKAAGKSPLRVLVNNASIYPETTLSDMTFPDLTRCIRINAWAPLVVSRAFAAQAGRPGCVVNILDNRITGRDHGHVAYLLSKQMLASVTRLCALEFSPSVRVNGVAPGLILPPAGKTRAYLDKLKKNVPLRAHGSPRDIASAVVFCVTSPFLTGEIITVDGGRHLL